MKSKFFKAMIVCMVIGMTALLSGQTVTVDLGTGTETNTTSGASPINIWYRSLRSQTVYTAAELNAAGIVGPAALQQVGYYVTASPIHNLPNFLIRIKHTTATNASAHDAGPFETVYTNPSMMPVAGDWFMMPFTIDFIWNGVDNILIDTAFAQVPAYNASGQQRIYTATNGMRFVRADGSDQTNATTTTIVAYKPQIRMVFLVADMGTLDGYVYNQANNNPLSGATIHVLDTVYQATTNASGYFIFPYLPEGTYDVEASIFGFNNGTIEDVLIEVDETTTINFYLVQLSNVTVSGQVVGSDFPTVGLEGATVALSGYENYNTVTGVNGMFSIPGVYSNQTYNIQVIVEGYAPYNGQVIVGDVDLNIGAIIVNEIAYPPYYVQATQGPDDSYVDLIWTSPLAIDYHFFDFEQNNGDWIPTATWHPVGDWEWTNTYDVNNYVVGGYPNAELPPTTAYSGTGLWGTVIYAPHTNSGGFSYLTQTFDFSNYTDATMIFWSWNNSFGNWDYGQVRVNGDLIWGPNYTMAYWSEVILDLSAYDGMAEVTIRFEHYATTVVNYAGWYIDDVYIGPDPQRRGASDLTYNLVEENRPLTRHNTSPDRVLEGYRIYRFLYEDLGNEINWVQLATVTDTTYTDLSWDTVPFGFYLYGVKSVHTNDVLSSAAISNWVGKDMTTNVTVNITTNDGSSAAGAEVTLLCLDEDPDGNSPVYTTTSVGSAPSVASFFNVLRGDYNLQVSLAGFETYHQYNISILDVTVINVQINEIPFPPSDVVAEVNAQNNVDITWTMPGTITGEEQWIHWDSGVNNDAIGTGAAAQFSVAARFTPDNIDDLNVGGLYITTIKFWPYVASATYTVKVWTGGGSNPWNAGTVAHSQLATGLVNDAWNEITLTSPVLIDPNQEIWIGYDINTTTGYPAGCDAGPAIDGYGNMMYWNNVWDTLLVIAPALNYNWNIQGYAGMTRGDKSILLANSNQSNRNISSAHALQEAVKPYTNNIGYLSTAGKSLFSGQNNSQTSDNMITMRSISRDVNSRAMEGYIVYRFLTQNQGNEDLWDEITTITVPTDTTYTDTDWQTLSPGVYRYAVKAIYTGNVLSPPGFSNILEHTMNSMVTINLTTNSADPVTGTQVTLTNNDMNPNHVYTMSAPASGVLVFPNVWRGTYMIEASLPGFDQYIAHNVVILTDTFMYNIELIETLLPVVDLTYEIFDDNNVTLAWLEPGTSTGTEQWIYWGTGTNPNDNGIGTNAAAVFSVAHRYTPTNIEDLNIGGLYVTAIRFWPRVAAASYTLKVWRGGSSNPWNAGTVIHSQIATGLVMSNWNEIELTTPVLIDPTQEIWIGYDVDTPSGHPAGCDPGPPVEGYGNMMFFNGVWDTLTGISPTLTFNWCIQGYAGATRGDKAVLLTRADQDIRDTADSRALLGYKIVRNDVVLAENITELTYTDFEVPNGSYVYGVIAQYSSGESVVIETEEITILSADEDQIIIPMVTELKGNHPNPFNPNTSINFSLKENSHVIIEIYNIKGQKVKTLVNTEMEKGNHSVVWNGRTDLNREAGSGIFFYHMKAGKYSATRKMILLK